MNARLTVFLMVCVLAGCGSDAADTAGGSGTGGSMGTDGGSGAGGSVRSDGGVDGRSGVGGGDANGGVGGGSGSGGSGRADGSADGNSDVDGGSATDGHTAAGDSESGTGAALEAGDDSGGTVSYSTNFDQTASPISEGGAWHHTDPNQSAVTTSDGLAYGTQDADGKNAAGGYDDSVAFLAGFPPNQRVTTVIHKTGAQPGNLEAEIWLRASEGAQRSTPFGDTQTSGYEINIQGNGDYIQIGRFKQLPALFDSMVAGSPLTSMGLHDGDVYSAEIVGNAITVWLNGTIIASATDTDGAAGGGPPIANGNPGVGFFRQDAGGTIDPKSFCFTSFTATGL